MNNGVSNFYVLKRDALKEIFVKVKIAVFSMLFEKGESIFHRRKSAG